MKNLSASSTNFFKVNEDFFNACSEGRIEVINRILNSSDDMGNRFSSGFYVACKFAQFDVVKILCEYNQSKNNNITQGFKVACENGYRDIVKYLIQSPLKQAVLISGYLGACSSGNVAIAKILEPMLETPINTNSAFMTCCKMGRYPMIEYMLYEKNFKVDPKIADKINIKLSKYPDKLKTVLEIIDKHNLFLKLNTMPEKTLTNKIKL